MDKKMHNSCDLLIVCALAAEAGPVIKHYELQHLACEYGFHLYGLRLKKKQKVVEPRAVINVLVSGVGKVNMAAALMWAQQICSPEIYINYGIAGHGSADVGEAVLINKVFDETRGKSYYPNIHFSWKAKTSPLKTVDTPSSEYLDEYAYDMEGSAFCEIVNRFVDTGSAHILKVISDNSEQSYQHISRQSLRENIETLLPVLTVLVGKLLINSGEEETDIQDIMNFLREKWRITAAQDQQLQKALLSTHVIEGNTGLTAPDWRSFDHLSDFLQETKSWITSTKPNLML